MQQPKPSILPHCFSDRSASSSNMQQSGLQGSYLFVSRCSGGTEEQLFKWNRKLLRQKSDHITITSDAYQSGWGAVCKGICTGVCKNRPCTSIPWSSWQPLHLATKMFLKDVSGTAALLQLNNATAMVYTNNMRGTVST